MKCVIVPERHIEALEEARKELFKILKDTEHINNITYSVTDKMYKITHSRYKEIDYRLVKDIIK